MVLIYVTFVFVVVVIFFYIVARIFMKSELKAAMDRDPSALNFAEIIFSYSGVHALIFYKIAHTTKN